MIEQGDQAVQVGKGYDATTVLKLYAAMKDRWDECYSHHKYEAKRNQRACKGIIERSNNRSLYDRYSGEVDIQNLKPSEENYLRKLVSTWTSRLLEDDPSVKAWPKDLSAADASRAETANQIIEYLRRKLKLRKRDSKLVELAQFAGHAIGRIAWDPLAGPMIDVPETDEAGNAIFDEDGVPLTRKEKGGEVVYDVFSALDFMMDEVEEIEDADRCTLQRQITNQKAIALVRSQYPDITVDEETLDDLWGRGKQGNLLTEFWHRPTPEVPEGFFALIVAEKYVVDYMAFPYDHGELPVCVFKVGELTNSPWGSTHVSDAVPVQMKIDQQSINEEILMSRWRRLFKFVGPNGIAEAIQDDEVDVVPVADASWAGKVGFINFPAERLIPLFQNIDRHVEKLHRLFGLNEALVNSSGSIGSGKAINFMKILDQQQFSTPSRNLADFKLRMWKQAFGLYQQYVDVERVALLSGADEGSFEPLVFLGADLEGFDIVLEENSGLTEMRASKIQTQQEEAQAGVRSPEDVSSTGLEGGPDEFAAVQIVEQQVSEIMRGGFAQPDPSVDPRSAVEHLRLAVEHVQATSPQAMPPLMALLQGYQIAMIQGRQPQDPQGQVQQAQPQQPGMPGGMPQQ